MSELNISPKIFVKDLLTQNIPFCVEGVDDMFQFRRWVKGGRYEDFPELVGFEGRVTDRTTEKGEPWDNKGNNFEVRQWKKDGGWNYKEDEAWAALSFNDDRFYLPVSKEDLAKNQGNTVKVIVDGYLREVVRGQGRKMKIKPVFRCKLYFGHLPDGNRRSIFMEAFAKSLTGEGSKVTVLRDSVFCDLPATVGKAIDKDVAAIVNRGLALPRDNFYLLKKGPQQTDPYEIESISEAQAVARYDAINKPYQGMLAEAPATAPVAAPAFRDAVTNDDIRIEDLPF